MKIIDRDKNYITKVNCITFFKMSSPVPKNNVGSSTGSDSATLPKIGIYH